MSSSSSTPPNDTSPVSEDSKKTESNTDAPFEQSNDLQIPERNEPADNTTEYDQQSDNSQIHNTDSAHALVTDDIVDAEPPVPTQPTDSAIQPSAAPDVPMNTNTGSMSPPLADEDDEEETPDQPMTLKEHFRELRKRLTMCVLLAFAGFFLCLPFAKEIYQFLVDPLLQVLPPPNNKLIFTVPYEAMLAYLKAAFLTGVFVASPFIFYQIWLFIAPGLYESERKHIIPVAIISALFFIAGGTFCYLVVFPHTFDFLMSYADEKTLPMPTVKDTLGFVLQLLLAFGIIFELPLFVFVLSRIGIITAAWMRKMRRYAILINVIIAAVLTPPDVMSQMFMAIPMLLLYELSIFVAVVFGKKSATPDENDDSDDDGSENITRAKRV